MATILRDRSAKVLRAAVYSFGPNARASQLRAAPAEDPLAPRTCRWCGEHVPFRVDPVDGWAECTACDRLN